MARHAATISLTGARRDVPFRAACLCRARHGRQAAWLGTALALCAAAASARERPASGEAYAGLRALLEAAPNRQVGQPGNAALDRAISERFAEAARRHNDPERRARAKRLADGADRAEEALIEAQQRARIVSRDVVSHFLVRATLEKPWTLATLLVMAAGILAAAWRVKSRRAFGVAAGAVFGAAVLLCAVAALVETKAERAEAAGSLARAVEEAARRALEADLEAAEALEGLWQCGRISFPSAAFVPGRATLVVKPEGGGGGGEVRLFQMSPNLVEPANLKEPGYDGWLTYAGAALPDDLAGRRLDGAAVLVEFDSGNRWLDAAQLGAEVVIVLEPPGNATFAQAAQKITTSPLSVPRYYVRQGELAAALGEGWLGGLRERTARVSIRQEPGRWERLELATDWLFIPGTAGPGEADTPLPEDPYRQIVHVQAYKDSASVVPGISPGACGAANVVLLLRLLERFENDPPRRPVLLSVVNDHANALNGEQEYSFAAFADPRGLREEIEEIDRELVRQRLIERVFSRPPTPDLIEDLRDRTETIGGRIFTVKEPAVDRVQRLCNAVREERSRLIVEIEKGFSRGKEGEEEGEAAEGADAPGAAVLRREADTRRRLEEVKREAEDLVALSGLFNRLGTKTYLQGMSAERQGKCRRLFADVAAQARVEAEELDRARKRLSANLRLRRRLLALSAPGGPPSGDATSRELPDDLTEILDRRYAPLPAACVLCLDLSFGSDTAGFFCHGYLGALGQFERHARERTAELARHTLAVAAAYERQTGRPSRLADTIRFAGGVPWQGHLGGRFAMGSRPPHQYAVAGLTLTSVNDSRPRAFTPHDDLSHVDRANLEGLMEFAEGYVPLLVDSERLGHTLKSTGNSQTLSTEISVRKLDKFSVTVPRTRVPGALLLAQPHAAPPPRLAPMFGQVRPWPVLMSDARGTVTLRGSIWNGTSLQVFAYDPDYRAPVAALDFGQGEKRFASTLWVKKSTVFHTLSVVTFEACKVDLIGLTEPLTLTPSTSIDVIDAAQDGTPRHYSVSGVLPFVLGSKRLPLAFDGSGSIFIEPRRRFKLRIGTGLVINATEDNPQGGGFPAEIGRLRNIVLTSATDMWRLTDSRLALLSKKGVVDETAAALKDAAGRQLGAVDAAARAGRNDLVQVGAEEARGLAYRTYVRTLGTTNDLIKAVVILLGLVVPFCFFVMKLITPFTEINRQLAMFVVIFVGTAAVLQAVHPAFEVAKTPQVVILAFVILGLAAFVASILVSRFNSSMTQAVEEAQAAESAEAPQSRLVGMAFMVGVNNMKRRRIRTSLTTATVVLVTFTMLSVISVGRDVEPVRLKLGGRAPYDGFLYVNPGMAPVDPVQVRRLRAHVAGGSPGDDRTVSSVARVWAERKGSFGEYFPVELRLADEAGTSGQRRRPDRAAAPADRALESRGPAPEKVLNTKIALGLEVAEDGFLGPMPVLPGGRWFSSNEAPELLLSKSGAEVLGITPDNFRGREIWLRGRRVELVGLLDDERIESMRDVADLPVLPLLTEASLLKRSQASALASETSAAALAEAGSLSELPGTYVANAREVAFVPAGFALSLGDASYRSLSVKYVQAGAEEPQAAALRVWDDAASLMRFQDIRLLLSLAHPIVRPEEDLRLDPGEYALVPSSTAEVGGVLKVAIPVVLAATIILNTMLGSVMERRREIGIYNAIGLNPTHVMVFFLAESLVFGLVGSVAGYMLGQILSLVLSRFVELNLNYSSLSVMLVIFLAIATVLASTIYPAMMAARAAVPSGQRRWSLPQPVGDQITVKFPFSYDARRAMGVCAFLREYMRQNSEASTGKFLAELGPVGVVPARSGEEKAYAMLFDIAPAPFDLGVNQKMEVYAYHDPHVRAHMLSVHLTRLSGQRSNWVTVNQPFLEALRKRLLSWRSQRPEIQEEYFRRGQQAFAGAPEFPVRPEMAAVDADDGPRRD